jgi:hypothetical protein
MGLALCGRRGVWCGAISQVYQRRAHGEERGGGVSDSKVVLEVAGGAGGAWWW